MSPAFPMPSDWPACVELLEVPYACSTADGAWTVSSMYGPDTCRPVEPDETCLRLSCAYTDERTARVVALFLLLDGGLAWLCLSSVRRH